VTEEDRREELERAYSLRRQKRQALRKVIKDYHLETPAPIPVKKALNHKMPINDPQAARRKIILRDE